MGSVARGRWSVRQAAAAVVLVVALVGALLPMGPAGAEAPPGDRARAGDEGSEPAGGEPARGEQGGGDQVGDQVGDQDGQETPPHEGPPPDEPPGAFDARESRPSDGDLDELERVAEDEGTVRAIVGLRTAFVPEGSARAQDVASQRAAIAREQAALDRELRGSGHRVARSYETLPFVAVELPPAAVERLRHSDRVASVELDEEHAPALTQSSPLVQATPMWDAGLTGEGVMVAILDTGVDSSHPFFGGRVVEEACYSSTGANLTSLCPGGATSATGPGTGLHCAGAAGCDHGTHVAGIAAGAGALFSGVAPDAELMSVQVFTRREANCDPDESVPCLRAFTADIMYGLERVHLINQDPDTTVAAANLSLGGGEHTTACDTSYSSMKAAIDNLRSGGAATVVASGNEGWTDAVAWPACISTAVSVGSTTKSDAVSSFSNGHPTLIDVLAPGSAITSALPGGSFAAKNGTSMAAPQVAGAWALMRSHAPGAAVTTILDALKATGLMVTDARGPSSFDLPRIRIYQAAFGSVPPGIVSLDEGFETVVPVGWTAVNRSTVPNTSWAQGNTQVFSAHGGPAGSYASASFNNTGAGTISNWLVSPPLSTLGDGGVLGFATRSVASSFPDRLEVRISTNGSCETGSTPTEVGDFDVLVQSINPDLEVGAYPGDWTIFQPTLSGIGAANDGCIAFRYFVTDSGPDGTTGDYIGIDSVTYAPATATVPSPPLGVSAVAGNQQAVVSWSAPASTGGSPVTGYTATANPGGATCTTGGALTCTISGLTNGTAYSVQVTATNAVGPSGPSSAVSVTPTSPVTVPSPPLGVSAVAGNQQAVVSWSAPASTGGSPVTGYTATASPGGRSCSTAGPLGCTITGLVNGTTYSVRVSATNLAGTSSLSSASSVTPRTVPGAPRGVAGQAGDRAVTVSWTAPASAGGAPITGYRVTASPGAQSCVTSGARSCTVGGLTNGTRYTFTVRATNAAGTGPASPASLPRWPTSPTQFTDTPSSAFFYAPVHWLAQRGVTTGCTPSAFCPADDVIRAQTATFIWRLSGSPAPSGPAFDDVPPDSYYASATRWMRAEGLSTGVGGTNFFEPLRATSRAEFVTLLWRLAGQPPQAADHGFADVPSGSYFEAPVAWAKRHGITTGVGGTNLFEPHRTVTRAEAAAFLVRYATTPAARGSKAVPIKV